MFLVGEGHVARCGGMAAAEVGAYVGGDALAFEEDFDGGSGELDVDGFVDEAARNAVVVVIDFDVVVDVDLGGLPIGEFVGAVREREGGGTVKLVEELAAGALDFAQGAVVELFEEFPDGGVHFRQGVKDAVP